MNHSPSIPLASPRDLAVRTVVSVLLALFFSSCSPPADPQKIDLSDSTAPANVTGLNTSSGDGQVTLSWSPPADSDFAAVEISAAGVPALTVAKGTNTKTITGLVNGTAYRFLVKSVDAAGNKSSGTTSAHVTPSSDTGSLGPILY